MGFRTGCRAGGRDRTDFCSHARLSLRFSLPANEIPAGCFLLRSALCPCSCTKTEQSRCLGFAAAAVRQEGQRCLQEGRRCLPGTLIFQFVYSDVWQREADRLHPWPPSASELKGASRFRRRLSSGEAHLAASSANSGQDSREAADLKVSPAPTSVRRALCGIPVTF